MNNAYCEIIALVEGKTERFFIQNVILPHLAQFNKIITPIILSKPGEKGGDVKFSRAQNDIELHLKQRKDTYLTLFVDYYGIRKGWPGRDLNEREKTAFSATQKAQKVNDAMMREICRLFADNRPDLRFKPFIAMYEFEALLFSNPKILAEKLHVNQRLIDDVLKSCGEPENINDSPQTAPSKRLEFLSTRYKKTSTGVTIATEIGLPRIREQCPIFNGWLTTLENLEGFGNGEE
jgi:hypothetical protein